MRAGRAYVTVRVNSYVPGPMAPMETRNKNASQEVPPNIKVSCKIPLHPILGTVVISTTSIQMYMCVCVRVCKCMHTAYIMQQEQSIATNQFFNK